MTHNDEPIGFHYVTKLTYNYLQIVKDKKYLESIFMIFDEEIGQHRLYIKIIVAHLYCYSVHYTKTNLFLLFMLQEENIKFADSFTWHDISMRYDWITKHFYLLSVEFSCVAVSNFNSSGLGTVDYNRILFYEPGIQQIILDPRPR